MTTSIVTTSILQRNVRWLPTAVVLAVVLVAGSRLIDLSAHHHAAAARETAAKDVITFSGKIEPLLQMLADRADRQATSAAQVLSNSGAPASLESVPPAAKTFWMTNDDKVLGSRPAETATANGIASEWRSAESTRTPLGSAVLGPLRLGSLWLVAIRYPVMVRYSATARGAPEAARSRGWSVAYIDLNELIAASHWATTSSCRKSSPAAPARAASSVRGRSR
jgi:hypothetical protein